MGFRVTVRISKGALREMRLVMREPPCLTVAPVIKTAVMVKIVE